MNWWIGEFVVWLVWCHNRWYGLVSETKKYSCSSLKIDIRLHYRLIILSKTLLVTILSKNLKDLVFWYQNCSDLLWEKIVLAIEKKFWNWGWRLRIFKTFEITRTAYSNSERSEQFLAIECFFSLFLEVS